MFTKFLNSVFELSTRQSCIRQEATAGLTTFLAMLYSLIVVPNMLGQAGFPVDSVFIATCLVTGLGSILMGLWANLPMAIGVSISLCAFTAFTLVLNNHMPIPIALGAIFLTGILFTLISITGVRGWILRNLPLCLAQGTGIGIGLFLLLIATHSVGIVVNNNNGLPMQFGEFNQFKVLVALIGLATIIGLENRQIKGSILWVILAITLLGILWDKEVKFSGEFLKVPDFHQNSLFLSLDLKGALNLATLPIIFGLAMTAVFDATGTIRAVAGQANLLNDRGQIINSGKALTTDSLSNILAGLVGTAPAAVYIESAAGTAVRGRTGLTAVIAGIGFLLMLFFQPLASLVPAYATAPALMYVGLLMMSNVRHLDFKDSVGAMSGLVCAIFIILTANIVTGIMLGFASLVIGRIVKGDINKLNLGTVIIALALVAFYLSGLAI